MSKASSHRQHKRSNKTRSNAGASFIKQKSAAPQAKLRHQEKSAEKSNSSTVSYIHITEDRAGQRLDNFLLSQLKGVPKSHVYRIVRSGEVRVNKGRAKPVQRLEAGDVVRVPPIRLATASEPAPVSKELAEKLSRCLVYEDDQLFIYNKPSGLAVHGGSGISLGLIETLRALYPNEKNLELVHRLDRDTSGLVMVARNHQILRRLQRLMQDNGVEKRYWLLCSGFKGGQRSLDAPLLKMMQGTERVVRVSRDGKASLTHFAVIERFVDSEWVEAKLETGRTHQIRVHAQHGGFPILGDTKYGVISHNERLASLGTKRLCLHARQLKFRHPISDKLLDIKAEPGEEFENAIDVLRQTSLKIA